jgi:hypothetical protein
VNAVNGSGNDNLLFTIQVTDHERIIAWAEAVESDAAAESGEAVESDAAAESGEAAESDVVVESGEAVLLLALALVSASAPVLLFSELHHIRRPRFPYSRR